MYTPEDVQDMKAQMRQVIFDTPFRITELKVPESFRWPVWGHIPAGRQARFCGIPVRFVEDKTR